MPTSPLAGQLLPADLLVDLPQLIEAYYANKPDVAIPEQRVSFGTSGHRGSSFKISFNENHVLSDYPSDLRLSQACRHQWPALHRHRYACAIRGRRKSAQ